MLFGNEGNFIGQGTKQAREWQYANKFISNWIRDTESNLSQTRFGIQNPILKSEILRNPINVSVWIEQFNLYFLFMKSLVKVLVWAKFSLHILERNIFNEANENPKCRANHQPKIIKVGTKNLE